MGALPFCVELAHLSNLYFNIAPAPQTLRCHQSTERSEGVRLAAEVKPDLKSSNH
jgi:hypothetical protein